jgi:hypothetical protein
MPTFVPVTYTYVSYGSGGPHARRPRGANAGFVTLDSFSDNNVEQGTPCPANPRLVPNPYPHDGVTYSFALVNISGGDPTKPSTNNPSTNIAKLPSVTVGTSPIEILVVYLPPAGPPPPPPYDYGASVDALYETSNTLVNNIFVGSVSPTPPNSGSQLVDEANVNGWVDTTKGPETIDALQQIVPTGSFPNQVTAVFNKWVNLGSPQSPPSGLNFAAAQGTSYILLALYNAPPPPPPLTQCQILLNTYFTLRNKGGIPPISVCESMLKGFAENHCSGQEYTDAINQLNTWIHSPPPR